MTQYYTMTIDAGAITFTPVPSSQPLPLRFVSPVTGKAGDVWGGDWFAAVAYAQLYDNGKAYHTGVDLNRPNYADSGAPVYAAADGEIVFASKVPGWQGDVIVIKHTLEDKRLCWTRYAHISISAKLPVTVKAGQVLGVIADYAPAGPQNDHLHYDVAWLDLGAKPGDWPGLVKSRVDANYINPTDWHRERGA